MVKKKKNVSFNTLVKKFIRDYNIPTKRDMDKILIRMDKMEKLLRDMVEKEPSPARSKKSVAVKKLKSSEKASEKVIRVIGKFEDGVKFSEIQKQTGFEEKKLRNIIYRLDKTGKIVRASRGIYIIP